MLFATPDRFVLLPSGWGALEVKRTGETWAQLPLRVQLQVQAQLAVLAMGEGRVAACMARDEVLPFEVPADTELAAMVIERVTLFWKRVVAREPPEPIAADREVVRKLWPKHRPGKEIKLGEGYEIELLHYEACAEKERLGKEGKDTAAARITNAMQDAEVAVFPSGRRVQWRVEPRAGYEVKASEPRVLRVLKVCSSASGRADPRDTDGDGRIPGLAAAWIAIAAGLLGRGDRLLPARDRVATGSTPDRLPHARRRRYGRVPGYRGVPLFTGIAPDAQRMLRHFASMGSS